MSTLYYEKCILHDKIPTKSLISLSQLQRSFNKNDTLENSQNYYEKLNELCDKLRYNRITVKEHPSFDFQGYKSTNWSFECIRVCNSIKKGFMQRAKEEEDLKERGKFLTEAMKISNEICRLSQSILFERNSNRLLKHLNPRYNLAQTCSIAAERFHTMYLFRPNILAIKRAFQLKEISTLLWNSEDENNTLLKYKATALLELANQIEDDKCGEKVALLEVVANKDKCPENVAAQYKVWKQQNEQVYYTPVYTDKKLETISLKEAFDILTKCFESPGKKSQH